MNYRREAVAAGDGCYFSRWDDAKPYFLDVYFENDGYAAKDAERSGAGGAFAGRFRGRFVKPDQAESSD